MMIVNHRGYRITHTYTHPNLLIVSLILAQDNMQKRLTWSRLQDFSTYRLV
jgi:hypothetical protein